MKGLNSARSFITDSIHIGYNEYLSFSTIFTQERSCVVGVSGGPDSIYLLCQTVSFFVRQGRDVSLIHIVHIDYGFRSDSGKIASILGQKSEGLHFHLYHYKGKEKEEPARDFRRECFENICQLYHIDLVLLGNHLDDRIETCLYRMIRGYGVYGLISFTHFSSLGFSNKKTSIYRPLISLPKQQILETLYLHQISFDLDITNNDEEYTSRNNIRKLIEHNKNQDGYYEAWQEFFWNIEDKYAYPIYVENLYVPDRVCWSIWDLTFCTYDELLGYCKAWWPHLSMMHFERIAHVKNGQKIEFRPGYITKCYDRVYHIIPRPVFQDLQPIIYIGNKTLNEYLKDRKIPGS